MGRKNCRVSWLLALFPFFGRNHDHAIWGMAQVPTLKMGEADPPPPSSTRLSLALCSLLLLFFLFPGLLFLEMLVGFQSSLTSPRRKISLHRLISYITYEYSAYPSCIGLLLRNTRKGGPQSVAPDVGIVFFPCLTRVRSPVLPAELI